LAATEVPVHSAVEGNMAKRSKLKRNLKRAGQAAGAAALTVMITAEGGEMLIEHWLHGPGQSESQAMRVVRPATPALPVTGKEHPPETARGYAGLSLTYQLAAVTTSSSTQARVI
jgi:hypothetical protein